MWVSGLEILLMHLPTVPSWILISLLPEAAFLRGFVVYLLTSTAAETHCDLYLEDLFKKNAACYDKPSGRVVRAPAQNT